MWAKTLCPLSSSTRNCVLGNASVIVPSTSMTSSLAKDLPCSQTVTKWPKPNKYVTTPTAYLLPFGLPRGLGQDPRSILRNCDGVLVVGGQGVIRGVDGPAVPLADTIVIVAQRDHGLYREGHAGQETWSGVRAPVVRDLGVLVHLASHTMRDQVAYYPVPSRLGQGLYRVSYSPEPLPDPDLLCCLRQALAGGLQQPSGVRWYLSDRHGRRAIGHEALVAYPDVQGDNVAIFEPVGARDTVYDHGVRRRADG